MSSLKTLIQVGAGATAMAGIYAAFVIVLPLLQSDPPPLASVDRVMMLAQDFKEYQQTQKTITDTLERVTAKQDQQDLDYWTGQLAIADARLKMDPRDTVALGLKKIAEDQILATQKRMTQK